MFRITLSPQFSNTDLTIIKQGKALIVNGDTLDFSAMQQGDEYPPEAINNPSVIGGAVMADGIISLTIILPYSNDDAPNSVKFPEPLIVIDDGAVALPDGRDADKNSGR